MKIAHMALWTQDLRQQARFWVSFFDSKINGKYRSKTDPGLGFYFVEIDEKIAVELMTKPDLIGQRPDNSRCGWVHPVASVGGNESIDIIAMQAQE